jgi:hypothetical protein
LYYLDDEPLLVLMRLAQKMGVDADALIEATERNDEARRRYSDNNPASAGKIEFDLTIELFGKRVTRQARVDHDYTPRWEYFDLNKRSPYEG